MKKMVWLILLLPFCAFSSVTITGTRVIYNENENNVTVKLSNRSNTASLIQAWVDNSFQNQSPSNVTSPFFLYPAVSKINSNAQQFLRIKRIEEIKDTQNESVYWLNVKDIPALPDDKQGKSNYLQLAIISKIKLFYRPASLRSQADDAWQHFAWRIRNTSGNSVIAEMSNQSHFYASLTQLRLKVRGREYAFPLEMVSPGKSQQWLLKGISAEDFKNGTAEYGQVNDFGAVIYRRID